MNDKQKQRRDNARVIMFNPDSAKSQAVVMELAMKHGMHPNDVYTQIERMANKED